MPASGKAKDVPRDNPGIRNADAMTAIFDSFGPTWRPLVQLASGYGGAAVMAVAVGTIRGPSDQIRWVFAGAAAPAIALVLGYDARTQDRVMLAATSTAVFAAAVALVAIPTIRYQLVQTTGTRIDAIANLDLIFVAAFVAGATCIGLLVRLIIDGDEAFTRPWASVLGDARWMTMREAKALLPPTGKVVVGEAYEPWKARRGSDDMVSSNPRTWGSGDRVLRRRHLAGDSRAHLEYAIAQYPADRQANEDLKNTFGRDNVTFNADRQRLARRSMSAAVC